MKKKTLIIMGLPVLAIVFFLVWYLLSPLFYDKRVDESLDDLFGMAGIGMPMEVVSVSEPVDIGTIIPPAGIDPLTESRGPTMPPPGTPSMPVMQMMSMINGVGQGQFVGLAGHEAKGTANMLELDGKYFIRFEEDFFVTNGPDLFVGLGKDGVYDKNAQVEKLKGNVGAQNYSIPEVINIEQYNEIWVWCRAFSVPFAKAQLN